MEFKKRNLTPEEFRKMQVLELGMLAEFDRVCKRHNIKYTIVGGTMLGAIRHKGFIPWDDDADIGMLREEYEKFKSVMYELNKEICYFQDHTTDSEYRWGYGKLRRTGTTYIRIGQEHLKCKTGIFVDIFPLDDCPKSLIGQMFQDFYCFCCRKILWSEVGRVVCKGFYKYWYTILSKIPTRIPFSLLKLYTKQSNNNKDCLVRTLCFTSIGKLYYKHPLKQRYGLPKQWFMDCIDYDFENIKVMGSREFDNVLSFWFGDYMKLPSEDQREQHSACSYIDFGNNN
ncbi:MAG: LicD family protein [Bacteroidales bacterium]|nr:LicD family protein [Bacteroidales bacterium]